MRKRPVILLPFFLLSLLLFQGCLFDITSVVGPISTSTGRVVTFTITGSSVSSGSVNSGGIVLQIPDGTSVLRVHYQYQASGFPPFANSGSGFLIETPAITSGYTAENGYHLYGGVDSGSNDGNSTITCKIWLSVPDAVTPRTYTLKAAVGGYTGAVWAPQNPQMNGNPIIDFSQISGKYASAPFSISAGTVDTTAPADVTPVVTGNINSQVYTLNMSAYNEAAQGDVAKYRIYLSKAPFSSTAGRQFLNDTTSPAVTGNDFNNVSFSSDIGTGLFYFEIPPGSEYPLTVSALTSNDYYFAITAVDISGNEGSPVVGEAVNYSISGTVTDGTSAISGASVYVYDANCNSLCSNIFFGNTSCASTDSNGTYTVSGLARQDYKVEFSANGFISEWYNDKTSCQTADAVSLTASNAVATVNAVLSHGGSISGTVTDGTNPLSGVSVGVDDENCFYVASGYTDANGNYTIDLLPAGSYNVNFYANGFLTQWYDNKSSCPAADTVPVTEGSTTTVNEVLSQGGSITGTVTNGTNPVSNVYVQIYDMNCYNFSSGTTDSNGNYSIGVLPSESYHVRFSANGYITEWNNDKQNCSSSDAVTVTAGNPTTVDAILSQGGSITGTVTNGTSGISGVSVSVSDVNCDYFASTTADANGNYSVAGLPTGNYNIYFYAYNYQSEWYNGKQSCPAADTVSVTEGSATTVNAVLSQRGSITGTVTNGTSAIWGVSISVYNVNCNSTVGWGNTDANGNYTVPLLPTGSYKVIFSLYGYLDQWFNGKTECASADVVAVTEPNATTGINAVLVPARTLSVYMNGTGAGTVASSPAGTLSSGINFGNSWSQRFPIGSQIDLTAWPSAGSTFDGWSGACTGNANPCTLTMTADWSVTAAFNSIVDFTASPASGKAPLFVSFTDQSKNNPTAWVWSFGDGATDTTQNPMHNYTTPGDYTISLVTENAGSFNSLTKPWYIYVRQCENQPVRAGNAIHYPYPTIQSAYDAAAGGDYVDAHAKDFAENLNFANDTSVTLRGGFNCEFSTNAGQVTTLHGPLTISGGPVKIENLVIE